MFTRYIDDVAIAYLRKENSSYPISFTVKPKNKNDKILQFYLSCDYDLYMREYEKLHKNLCTWIDQEKKLHDRLGYSSDSGFLFLFKNVSILNLPENIESISLACKEEPYQIFPRFMNFLSFIEISSSQTFLDAIKGRFFYFLLLNKEKHDLPWKYSDFYKLAYYYPWIYLISVFQSTNASIVSNNNKFEIL